MAELPAAYSAPSPRIVCAFLDTAVNSTFLCVCLEGDSMYPTPASHYQDTNKRERKGRKAAPHAQAKVHAK